MKAVRNLLGNIIDYAGLFPPAALSMQEAVAKYYEYLMSEYRWLLSRFILPVSRFEEFEVAAAGYDAEFAVSAISDGNLDRDLQKIAEFNARNFLKYSVECLEVKTSDPTEVGQISAKAPEMMLTYVEIPFGSEEYLKQLAAFGRRAKIRTGGVTKENFPAAEFVVDFLVASSKLNVAFKATAGLHHPLRSSYPLTYALDSERCLMHGFLNLFLAAIFAKDGLSRDELLMLLLDEDAAHFSFSDEEISWCGHSVEAYRVAELREKYCISFGSCSFEEPVNDLKQLGLL
ncbi:MAG: hypothetical protein RMM17_11005 [Acidobacteriota bacterium]|nr:hypothetical protein [Blastocatellia bacterium]MDW8413200.1 hypothetical protein [Acidobacteriota bacterium]